MVTAPKISGEISEALVGRTLVEANSEAIIACDRDGIIRLWSPGATRMFGHSAQEALGQSLDVIIPERLRARHWDAFHKTMQTGESRYAAGAMLAVPGLRRDGSQISIEFTITPMTTGGAIIGLVAVIRDVTKTFEELKALRRKG
jgi:PAS domain S-box-containing protein